MTQYSTHREEPTSGFGGFLLFAGFLLAAFALVAGAVAVTGFAAEQGAVAAQNTIDTIAVFTVPMLLTAMMLVFLGLALDLRRMARTMHDTAEHAVDAMEELTHHDDTRRRTRRVIPVVTIPEHSARETARPAPEIRTPAPPRRAPGTGFGGPTASPAAVPRGVGAGTRHMQVPRAAGDTSAPPWSGGPGTPAPGPEPGPQPPHWQGQEHGEGEHDSARPEPWRHSSVEIRRRS